MRSKCVNGRSYSCAGSMMPFFGRALMIISSNSIWSELNSFLRTNQRRRYRRQRGPIRRYGRTNNNKPPSSLMRSYGSFWIKLLLVQTIGPPDWYVSFEWQCRPDGIIIIVALGTRTASCRTRFAPQEFLLKYFHRSHLQNQNRQICVQTWQIKRTRLCSLQRRLSNISGVMFSQ